MTTTIALAMTSAIFASSSFSYGEDDSFLVRFANLSRREKDELIKQLGREKDFSLLESIRDSEPEYAPAALWELGEHLPLKEALALRDSYPHGCRSWGIVMLSMCKRPKKDIIQDVIKAANDKDPDVRYIAYTICRNNSWDEIVLQAKEDLSKRKTWVKQIQSLPPVSIAVIAEAYLREVFH